MSDTVLEVDQLTKTFDVGGRRLHAVDSVSLSIGRGETLGLVGESGSGKSTIGRSVVRLDSPDSGTVTFEGRDITRLKGRQLREARRSLQMVFQNPATCLDPQQRVGDALTEPLAIHGRGDRSARQARVAQLLDRVGLSSAHGIRYPHELSGGQRQRVGIARALALDPTLIVADEPTSSLDLSIQAQIVNLLLRLQEEDQLAYLFISHDLGVVRHLSHRVAVLYLGRVVEYGPVDKVLTEPLHPYTTALLSGAGAGGRHDRIHLEGEVPSPIDRPTGCAFRTRCPAARDECAGEVPPLVSVGDGRSVACVEPGVLQIGRAGTRRHIAVGGAVERPAAPAAAGASAGASA